MNYLRMSCRVLIFFFFFNDTATTEIYTLSLHDALPISFIIDLTRRYSMTRRTALPTVALHLASFLVVSLVAESRSEEHTSELQSQSNLVCRLLLEKKKNEQPRGQPLPIASQCHVHACAS